MCVPAALAHLRSGADQGQWAPQCSIPGDTLGISKARPTVAPLCHMVLLGAGALVSI